MKAQQNIENYESRSISFNAQSSYKSDKIASLKPPPYSNKESQSEKIGNTAHKAAKSKKFPKRSSRISKRTLSKDIGKESKETQYYAYWTDIKVLDSPGGMQKEEIIEDEKNKVFLESNLEKAYSIQDKKVKDKKEYFLLESEGETIGWVNKSDLFIEKDVKRTKFVNEYKNWLNERYKEISKIVTIEKIERVKGILAQAEQVIADFQNGIKVDIKNLSTAPKYNSPQKVPFALSQPKVKIFGTDYNEIINPSFNDKNAGVTTPHELIEPLRIFADLTETKIQNVDIETNSNLNAGSLYSDIDWHSRLKLPQYRTQSDNLTSPEATCAPTSFAMMAERAGFSRAKLVRAIDQKLIGEKELVKMSQEELNRLWTDKGVEFLKATNKGKTDDWAKVRNGKIRSNKFKGITKDFRIHAQYEDLVYFYQYLLNGGSRGQINASKTHNNKLRNGIETEGGFVEKSKFELEQIQLSDKLDSDRRKELKEYLDKGYPMMFSIFHKGDDLTDYRHNVAVQSIDSTGIIIDDPYGKENPAYRNNGIYRSTDLFEKDGLSRGKSGLRNQKKYNSKDYTKEKGQDLEANESRGRNTKLTWEMLNDSKEEIISYINVWKKRVN